MRGLRGVYFHPHRCHAAGSECIQDVRRKWREKKEAIRAEQEKRRGRWKRDFLSDLASSPSSFRLRRRQCQCKHPKAGGNESREPVFGSTCSNLTSEGADAGRLIDILRSLPNPNPLSLYSKRMGGGAGDVFSFPWNVGSSLSGKKPAAVKKEKKPIKGSPQKKGPAFRGERKRRKRGTSLTQGRRD